MAHSVERRAYKRETVDLPAQLRQGDCLIDGKICDCSAGGYFFYPEVGYVDGRFAHTDEILSMFGGGDTLDILVFSTGKTQPEFTAATQIRWSGDSGHGCCGFGLQNQASILKQAA